MRRPDHVRVPPQPVETTAVTSVMKAVNVRQTLATNPIVQKAFADFGVTVLNNGSIPPRQRELVIMRMGWRCESVYEFGQHTLMARSLGITDDEIRALTRPLALWPWSPVERALLQMVDDLHAGDCISDTTWAELTEHLTHAEVLEHMAVTLFYRMVSSVLNSCGVELDEGVPGWPD